jgi:ankyrin repeat protein
LSLFICSGEATQWNDSLKIFQAIEAEDLKLLKECLFIKDNNNDSQISDSDNSEKNDKNEKSEKVLEHSMMSEADSKQLVQVLNLRDSSGLTPLLFAADRGLCQVPCKN